MALESCQSQGTRRALIKRLLMAQKLSFVQLLQAFSFNLSNYLESEHLALQPKSWSHYSSSEERNVELTVATHLVEKKEKHSLIYYFVRDFTPLCAAGSDLPVFRHNNAIVESQFC